MSPTAQCVKLYRGHNVCKSKVVMGCSINISYLFSRGYHSVEFALRSARMMPVCRKRKRCAKLRLPAAYF